MVGLENCVKLGINELIVCVGAWGGGGEDAWWLDC